MPSSAELPAAPPDFGTGRDYGASLSDGQFWAPWAQRALQLSEQPARPLTAGFPGTYPVLLDDQVAVKLFGQFPGWRQAHRAESDALAAVAQIPGMRVPALLGTGELYPGAEQSWPYLVMSVVPGTAWRELGLDPAEAATAVSDPALVKLAGQVGEQIGRLHRSTPPAGLPAAPLRTPDQVAARHRGWGSLPTALLDQIEGFLARFTPGPPVLVHADLTQDHLLIQGRGAHRRLGGIIDFGDAQLADPHLELGALQLGAFAGRRDLLEAFLAGHGWRREADFAERALAAALAHEFDLFEQVTPLLAVASLPDLARRLFGH